MSDYIERQAVIDTVVFGITIANAFNNDTGVRIGLFANENAELIKTIRRINDLPSADVAPVRHGRWIKYTGMGKVQWMCSECSAEEKNPNVANYCYYCGAKMDGEG